MNLDINCSNCGKLGHTHKNCIEPIISYGIIAYNKYHKKYLILQRRHSIAFVDFVRGKYSFSDLNFLLMLLSKMNNKEKDSLRYFIGNFEGLWDSLWINNTNIYDKDSKEYKNSKRKYEMLVEGFYIGVNEYNLNILLNECAFEDYEIEWGFPKGRREKNEGEIECAIREFCEETNINDIGPRDLTDKKFIEEFIGSNGIAYKYEYFLCILDSLKLNEGYIDYDNIEQKAEVGAIEWATYEECLKKLNTPRQHGLLRKINNWCVNNLKSI